MSQTDDINELITQLFVVADEVSGTISWDCKKLAERLAEYVQTIIVEEEAPRGKGKKQKSKKK
jgi:hypothetical protein